MSRWEFYAECIRRAFRGRLAIAELVSGLLALVAVPMGIEGPEWWKSLVGSSNWLPLYIFGTAFVVFVLWGLVRAPADMHMEALAEIGALRLTIEDRDRVQRALNELWGLRKSGVDLRNRHITDDDGAFQSWQREFETWHAELLQSARAISENLAQWLSVLDQTTQGTVVEPRNPKHGDLLRFYSEVLHRLQVFLERDLRWPRMG